MLVTIDMALALHRSMDRIVQVLPRLVVWRDDEGRLRILHVLVGDAGQTLLARTDFMNMTLVVESFDRPVHLASRQLFDNRLSSGSRCLTFRPDAPYECLLRTNACFLELMIRSGHRYIVDQDWRRCHGFVRGA